MWPNCQSGSLLDSFRINSLKTSKDIPPQARTQNNLWADPDCRWEAICFDGWFEAGGGDWITQSNSHWITESLTYKERQIHFSFIKELCSLKYCIKCGLAMTYKKCVYSAPKPASVKKNKYIHWSWLLTKVLMKFSVSWNSNSNISTAHLLVMEFVSWQWISFINAIAH